MISRTKIKLRINKKSNPEIVETLRLALKNKPWHKIASIISSSARKYSSVNLADIEKQTTAGDTIIVIGKVLSSGSVTKKLRVCAFGFSKQAIDKLKATKSEISSVKDEIKINPKATGLKIIQ